MRRQIRETRHAVAMRKSQQHSGRRRGAVVVELAICAPILFLLFFASLEFCRVAMIRHTVDNAVYEGCRVGIIPGATTAEVRTETQRILATLGLRNTAIAVTPSRIERDTPSVAVRVNVPLAGNSFVPGNFFAGQQVTRELTLRREGAR